MSEEIDYEVITKTSKHYEAGSTDASVFILLIGNNATCAGSWAQLDRSFWNDFERGRTDKFTIKSKDVGLPEVIRIRIDKSKNDNWLCDWVTVKHPTKGEVFFSIYDVVEDQIAARTGDASLPQNDKLPLFRDIRRIERDRNKNTYQWHIIPTPNEIGWDLPRYGRAWDYNALPLLFQANDVLKENFDSNREKAFYNTFTDYMCRKFSGNEFTSLDQFNNVYHFDLIPSAPPSFLDRWEEDSEFGRQVLSGVNPSVIKLCEKLPDYFQNAAASIFGQASLHEKLIKKKSLYLINYRGVFNGLRRNTNKRGDQLYCTDSVCLLQVGADNELRPVAIQLEEGGEIFTPNDSKYDWMLAKMYFRNSDSNMHEFQSHLLRTHIVIEPIAIAMFQSLARTHPLYKLMRPHLQTVASINTLGRTFLIGPGSSANYTLSINGLDCTRAAFRALTFDDIIIPNTFKKNGTDDATALPNYNYREDALRLWSAIETYVKNVVNHYYKCDQDVCNDYELADFIRNVALEGIGWQVDGTKGFPTKIETIVKLVEFCTTTIFTSSAQHAASNFGQLEIYKFVPNAPGGMRLPPHKKGEASMQRILKSLPDPVMASLQVGVAFTLSSFSDNELFLGNYPMKLFTEKVILDMQEEFRQDLARISQEIKDRNKSLPLPYEYLLPERVPNGIAV